MNADLGNGVSEVRITQQKPAPRSDAVGLVLKLVRPHLVEIMETVTTTATLTIYCTKHNDVT